MAKPAPGVNEDNIERADTGNEVGLESEKMNVREAHEVFKKSAEGVDFRTVSCFVSAVLITGFSSVRTFSRLGWLTWVGFFTFFIAVFIFVVAVTQQSRPAIAPPTGDFELGWTAIAYPSFAAGITASANIFISGSGSMMYMPVVSEMKNPTDYRKACLVAGFFVGVLYLTFSLVIFRWCGVWIATPAFGSAGELFKKISYGIALPGLVIGVGESCPIWQLLQDGTDQYLVMVSTRHKLTCSGIYQHVAAKLIFIKCVTYKRLDRDLHCNPLPSTSSTVTSLAEYPEPTLRIMSTIPLHPLAEHVYNMLLLNEDASKQMIESRIQGLKIMSNNIHFLARTHGGIDARPDQISITNTIIRTGEVQMHRIVVVFHWEDGTFKRLVDAAGNVDGVESANDVLARLLSDAVNKGL
ncbi:uncharacterized protein N0V89_004841 [Didymosphaeria variabile]|uniref:Amino acid transporter transmembrane domain-containing protein n=1 Tax=Didymosphaeria variabile TaxID=1932322 RepID=A0A9W8XR16_9PLEO|nr:uncharacterized protein N0V89_004841 [Didymosphaeria variabile]KAJ4356804.1 hypothetical protein N0V89_004841 [Didymosphaeria variabile]